MGERGPVPKRSAERRRQNKDEVETVQPITATVAIPSADPSWHPIALGWYESLKDSGQSQFYEPSDWWAAQYIASVMSRNLKQRQKFSAVLFASVTSSMNDLLTTEAARRRVRLEIERKAGNSDPASVTAIADYRKRLSGAGA